MQVNNIQYPIPNSEMNKARLPLVGKNECGDKHVNKCADVGFVFQEMEFILN